MGETVLRYNKILNSIKRCSVANLDVEFQYYCTELVYSKNKKKAKNHKQLIQNKDF